MRNEQGAVAVRQRSNSAASPRGLYSRRTGHHQDCTQLTGPEGMQETGEESQREKVMATVLLRYLETPAVWLT